MKKFRNIVTFILVLSILSLITTSIFAANDLNLENLALGKSYVYEYSAPGYYPNDTPSSQKLLTNGIVANFTNWQDKNWNRFLHGGERSVILNLGSVDTITSISIIFLQSLPVGIYFPQEVTYALSQNGTDWSVVGTLKTQIPLSSTGTRTVVQNYILSDLNYQAKYVKLTFTVDIWVFATDFSVIGYQGITNNATIPPITPPATYVNSYLSPGSQAVGGAKNVVLIYDGFYESEPSIGFNTVNELKPYVGYYDDSNHLKDFMFDGFLFLPYGESPSGATTPYYGNCGRDWEYFLNATFSKKYNLGALNTAVAEIKDKLNKQSYKAKVFISVFYPDPNSNFGSINGTTVNTSTLKGQEEAIIQYINEVLNKWKTADYNSLDLAGFYWDYESISVTATTDQKTLLNYISNYVKSKNLAFVWIPFNYAPGYINWKEYGFTAAILQPNYAWNDEPISVLRDTAETAKKFGMGIEMELHWFAPTQEFYRQKWFAYMNAGLEYGYMDDAVHFYYQSGGPGTLYDAYLSTDPQVRAIYDETYKFIKGTYKLISTPLLEK